MKAKIKKVTKEKVVLTMDKREASILLGVLNHSKINGIDPVIYNIWATLDDHCNYDSETFGKVLMVVK